MLQAIGAAVSVLDDLPGLLVARTAAIDRALLGTRLTVGGYLAGHGAQKLFGAFGGHGISGITLGRTIWLAPRAPLAPELLLHELRHVHQFASDRAFPLRYVWRSLRYHHAVWHLFVVGGSVLQFLSVLWYVLPKTT